MIEKHNQTALFSTIIKKNKYYEFNKMKAPTLDEIVRRCEVRKRDKLEFKKMKLTLTQKEG